MLLLLLIVRVLQEVSLLSRCLHLGALGARDLRVALLWLSCLLVEQLSLQERVRVGCRGRTAHERIMEALVRPSTSVRSHSKLLASGRLLLVVRHLPLQHGLLVRLLLQVVLIEGCTKDRTIVIKQEIGFDRCGQAHAL